MNNTKYHTTKKIVEEDRLNLWDSIDHYNRNKYPTNSIKYGFTSRVSKAKIKEIQDNRILYPPIVNNQKNNSSSNLPTKKTLFKYTVQQPPYNSFMLLQHH